MSKALPPKGIPGGTKGEKPPKEYREAGATKRSDYADPKNFKYPIDTYDHVRAAISYFSKPKNAGVYSVPQQKSIWGRIKRAAKKHGIEIAEGSGPPAVEEKAEKALPSEEAGVSPAKAREILRHGEVGGRPLTEAQRGMFGAIAGKARKSMADGIDSLGEYFQKGSGPTLESTVNTPEYRNLGPMGMIEGDNPAGKGGLPHGDTNYYGVGDEDGGYNELQEHTTGQGPMPPPTEGNRDKPEDLGDPTGALLQGYRKSMLPDGTILTPGRLAEMTAQQRAQVISQLQKSDDISPGIGVDPAPATAPEPEPMAKSFRQGDLAVYTDFSDRAAEGLAKGDSFYHGPPPNPLATGTLRKSKTCDRGHVMPAMLTSCPGCGIGSQFNPSAPGPGITMAKSGRGLMPAYEPDLVMPHGTLRFDEE